MANQQGEIMKLNSISVLIVDDLLNNQVLTIRLLKNLGHTVHAVANGKEALIEVQLRHFDLILMDCQMPEMDGYEATKLIRALNNETLKNIPIVAYTSNETPGHFEICLSTGMNDYLQKPCKRVDLCRIIEKWVLKRAA